MNPVLTNSKCQSLFVDLLFEISTLAHFSSLTVGLNPGLSTSSQTSAKGNASDSHPLSLSLTHISNHHLNHNFDRSVSKTRTYRSLARNRHSFNASSIITIRLPINLIPIPLLLPLVHHLQTNPHHQDRRRRHHHLKIIKFHHPRHLPRPRILRTFLRPSVSDYHSLPQTQLAT